MKQTTKNGIILASVAIAMIVLNVGGFLLKPVNSETPSQEEADVDNTLFKWKTAPVIPGDRTLLDIFVEGDPDGWGSTVGFPEKAALGYTRVVMYMVGADIAQIESLIGMKLVEDAGQNPGQYGTVKDKTGDFLANDGNAILNDGTVLHYFEIYHFY